MTLRYEEIMLFVRLLQRTAGLAEVHVTGGEPLERRGILTLVEMLAGAGIEDLAMTTNGQHLARLAGELKRAGLRRINISLHGLTPRSFRELTGGGDLSRTLEGIDAALAAGLAPVKLNTTVVRGANDGQIADIAQLALGRGMEARFIELMPLGPAAERHEELFVSSEEVLHHLRQRFSLRPLARGPGSSSRRYQVVGPQGTTGTVGVISPCTRPFCGDCNRLRLTASGVLLGCLAQGGGEDILPLLRNAPPLDGPHILQQVREVMSRKRTGCGFARRTSMVQIGG
jgi:cyclic pyranopterin phosphate synthase